MESVIPCEPKGSRGSLLSPTDSQQAVDYRDFCYTPICATRNGKRILFDAATSVSLSSRCLA